MIVYQKVSEFVLLWFLFLIEVICLDKMINKNQVSDLSVYFFFHDFLILKFCVMYFGEFQAHFTFFSHFFVFHQFFFLLFAKSAEKVG